MAYAERTSCFHSVCNPPMFFMNRLPAANLYRDIFHRHIVANAAIFHVLELPGNCGPLDACQT